jgi:hypothetical protein
LRGTLLKNIKINTAQREEKPHWASDRKDVWGSRCEGGGTPRAESEETGGGGEAKVAYGLNREMGISMAEVPWHLGVGASAIAMALRKEERAQ